MWRRTVPKPANRYTEHVQFDRRLFAPVFSPVHAIGDELNGTGVDHINHAFETARKSSVGLAAERILLARENVLRAGRVASRIADNLLTCMRMPSHSCCNELNVERADFMAMISLATDVSLHLFFTWRFLAKSQPTFKFLWDGCEKS